MRRDYRWAAGFLEGEGSFSLERGFASRRRKRTNDIVRYGPYETARIMAEQKQKGPLQRLRDWFGGGLSRVHRRGHNPTWCWNLSGIRAVSLLRRIYPQMSLRRKRQIRKATSYLSRRRLIPRKRIVIA